MISITTAKLNLLLCILLMLEQMPYNYQTDGKYTANNGAVHKSHCTDPLFLGVRRPLNVVYNKGLC